jgi:hypothetical protein
MNKQIFAPAVASGLSCSDGIWSLPSSILLLLNINPPMCLRFFSAETNYQVEEFLWTLQQPGSSIATLPSS